MTPDEQGSTAGLRRLFLDAARAILAEPDTSLELRKVAERAGKSRTAPYLAFGKSDEGGGLPALQLAVAAEGFRELVSGMRGAVRGARDPREALEAMATAYLAFADQHPRLFRLMFGPEVRAALDDRPAGEPVGEAAAREQAGLREARRALERVIQDTIEAQAPGYLASTLFADSATVTGAIWALLHGVAVLTIDQQWGLGELAGTGAPDDLAWRVLGFLTSESARSLEDAARLLHQAKATKGPHAPHPPGRAWAGEARAAEARESFAAEAPPPTRRPPPALPPTRDNRVRGSEMPRAAFFSLGDGPDDEERMESPPSVEGDLDERMLLAGAFRGVRERGESLGFYGTPHALHRARMLGRRLDGLRLLWIDDDPSANRIEIRMFQQLGMQVELATSTGAALERLMKSQFHLVLSDIDREGRGDEGIRALPMIRKMARGAPVIFYVAKLLDRAPPPGGALGITNDPEELLELVLDGVEGRR